MNKQKLIGIRLGRRAGLASLVIALAIGGVAFALLQNHADLTGNSIQTASAGLYISKDGIDYANTSSGYAFTGIIPGSRPSQTEHFHLYNTGSAAAALKLSASPPDNPVGVDLSKVSVILTPHDPETSAAGTPQSFSLQSLVDAGTAGGLELDSVPSVLDPGVRESFDIQVGMDADATDGPSAALSDLDLTFTAVATDNGN